MSGKIAGDSRWNRFAGTNDRQFQRWFAFNWLGDDGTIVVSRGISTAC